MLNQISPFIRAQIVRKDNGDLDAPDNIIKTLSAAYQQFIALRNDHLGRIELYSAISGMIGGNPPYDERELEENGLGHIANFNNFKARSNYEKEAQSFWNLINSTEIFTKIVLTGNNPQTTEWAETMARHFSDVVKEWPDFNPNFNLLGAQLTQFGICPVFFPHEESPFWEVIDVSRFYIPSQTQVYTSKLTNVCVETTYTVQELYQIYADIKEGDAWNKESLGNYLILKANVITPNNKPFTSMMDVERWIQTNSSNVNSYFSDNVRLVNMYQKEYSDGKISHYIFSVELFQTTNNTSNAVTNSTENPDDTTKDFLYFVDRQYDSIDQAIIIFTASPGEWNIHANLGLGQKMFAMSQSINMLDCTVMDMAKMSATPLIKTLSTGGRDSSPIRFYPGVFTDIGAAEIQQNTLGANINQVIGAAQYFTAGIESNAVNAGDDPSVPDKAQGSISPSEARQKSFKEFGVLKNVVAHFYSIFDRVIFNMFIHFLTMGKSAPGYEYASEWKSRCIEDGVPEILFDTSPKGLHGLPRQFRSVKASRVAGDGSTLARIMGLESFAGFGMTSMLNPKELHAWKKEVTSATLGVDYIPMFSPDSGIGDELSGGASLARAEDNFMALGKEALWTVDNDQAAHADEHMGSCTQIVQSVAQQQMSPVDADKIMELEIPHLTQHIQFMMKSPQFYQQTLNKLKAPFSQLLQWAKLNKRNAESIIEAAQRKQQEDQAKTQQVMSDAQRKDFVAHSDVARSDNKVEAQNTRADKANETRAGIMEKKAEADIRIKENKAASEADIKANATAAGRSKKELENTPPAQLSSQLQSMLGKTPATADFEKTLPPIGFDNPAK